MLSVVMLNVVVLSVVMLNVVVLSVVMLSVLAPKRACLKLDYFIMLTHGNSR